MRWTHADPQMIDEIMFCCGQRLTLTLEEMTREEASRDPSWTTSGVLTGIFHSLVQLKSGHEWPAVPSSGYSLCSCMPQMERSLTRVTITLNRPEWSLQSSCTWWPPSQALQVFGNICALGGLTVFSTLCLCNTLSVLTVSVFSVLIHHLVWFAILQIHQLKLPSSQKPSFLCIQIFLICTHSSHLPPMILFSLLCCESIISIGTSYILTEKFTIIITS